MKVVIIDNFNTEMISDILFMDDLTETEAKKQQKKETQKSLNFHQATTEQQMMIMNCLMQKIIINFKTEKYGMVINKS